MLAQKVRSSRIFVVLVVCTAVFTDTLLLNIIIPILPFVLTERVGLSKANAQEWNSMLLASFGGAMISGSRTFGLFQYSTSTMIWFPSFRIFHSKN